MKHTNSIKAYERLKEMTKYTKGTTKTNGKEKMRKKNGQEKMEKKKWKRENGKEKRAKEKQAVKSTYLFFWKLSHSEQSVVVI